MGRNDEGTTKRVKDDGGETSDGGRRWWLDVALPVLFEWVFAISLVIGLPLGGAVRIIAAVIVSVTSLLLALVLVTREWRKDES